MEIKNTNSFFEKANILANKYSPIMVLLTLFGTIAVGGSYLLSIKNHIEHNNSLIDKYYDELRSQRSIIISFKDNFHSKNEELVKQLTKSSTFIDGIQNKLNEISERLITIESRLYDLNLKNK